MSTEPAAIARFRDAHAALGGAGEIVILPESVHTAALAAAALGCEVGAIANSLLFDTGGSPVLILTSGSHRVDTQLTSERIGVKQLKRATPEFVREHTGQAIGGVAPVGHPKPIRTLVDTALAGYDVVWAAGGIPPAVFPTTFDELVRVTTGTPAEVA
jgi:prolyl-tRNA editing enzyme YbaK/EbsC (Cys-tRNA(Pro) deacylase)